MDTISSKRFSPKKLLLFMSSALQKVGVPSGDAELTAEMLLDADLRGIDSHGIYNFYGYYIKGIQNGTIKACPDVKIEKGSPTTVSVDGDNGLGFIAGNRAMDTAISMAKEYGTGWATVFNSNHFGAGSYYALMAAKQNMIGFVYSTGGTTVAGPGGKQRLVGNNVFAFAAPGGLHGPFVLDMAPTMAIANKLHMLKDAGKEIPAGWTVDSDGQPITDPGKYFAQKGAVLPLGSSIKNGVYKGFGLLLISDILSGLLSGDGGSMFRRKGHETHAFCALRIDAFPAAGNFTELMDEMIEKIHSSPTVEETGSMKYPGERENLTYEDRVTNGIPVGEKVLADLENMSREFNLTLEGIFI